MERGSEGGGEEVFPSFSSSPSAEEVELELGLPCLLLPPFFFAKASASSALATAAACLSSQERLLSAASLSRSDPGISSKSRLQPTRYSPLGFFGHEGLIFSFFPPEALSIVMEPSSSVTAFRIIVVATSPLPVQSLTSSNLGPPPGVSLRPEHAGSTPVSRTTTTVPLPLEFGPLEARKASAPTSDLGMQSATRAAMASSVLFTSVGGGGGCEEVDVIIEVALDAEAIVGEEEGAPPALLAILLLLLFFAFRGSLALLVALVLLLEGAGGLKEALGMAKEEAARSIIRLRSMKSDHRRKGHNIQRQNDLAFELLFQGRGQRRYRSYLRFLRFVDNLLDPYLPPARGLGQRTSFPSLLPHSTPSTATSSSSSSSSPALQAPPPSATRPGEAWAELVPSTRQFEALKGALVTRVSEPEAGAVPVSSLLLPRGEGEGRNENGKKTLLVVARSFGCPFCQDLAASLGSQAIPVLDSNGISLYLVSIGTPETGKEFAKLTGFPAERLLADPGTQTYDALGLERGLAAAFFSPRTPLAIAKRASTAAGREGLGAALGKWRVFLPPRVLKDAQYQGGAFVFVSKEEKEEGDAAAAATAECVWARLDRATADHAPAEELPEVALKM